MGLDNISLIGTSGVLESYSTWASGHSLVGDDANLNADTIDQDGIPNALEAWFGTNPREQDTAGIYVVSTDRLTTTFTHAQNEKLPADLSGVYEWSLNLDEWYRSDGVDGPLDGPKLVSSANTVGSVTTVSVTSTEALDCIFIRAVVTQN